MVKYVRRKPTLADRETATGSSYMFGRDSAGAGRF
jgi:hypothetical protein